MFICLIYSVRTRRSADLYNLFWHNREPPFLSIPVLDTFFSFWEAEKMYIPYYFYYHSFHLDGKEMTILLILIFATYLQNQLLN